MTVPVKPSQMLYRGEDYAPLRSVPMVLCSEHEQVK